VKLTARFFAAFGFIQVLGILATTYEGFTLFYAAALILLTLFTLIDYKTLADDRDFQVTCLAPRAPRLSQTATFSFRMRFISSRARMQSAVEILPIATELFEFKEFPLKVTAADETFTAVADVLKLGYERIERVPVSFSSQNGFFRRSVKLPIDPVEIRVSPERAFMSEQAFSELLHSQHFFHLGARQHVRTRTQDQIYSIRRYQYPDPLRHIDQKKTARFGEPMTRTFDTLRNHHLIIALDLGRAMAGEIRGSRKIDYYLSAALALAENALTSRDEVSFIAFSRTRHHLVRRARNIDAFHALFRAENTFDSRDEESNFALIAGEIDRLAGSRAIVVVLTDTSKLSVQEGILRAISPISHKHLAVVTGLTDRDADLEKNIVNFIDEPQGFEDRYAKLLHSYWMHDKHSLFQGKLARIGAASLVVNDAYWMTTVERLYGLLRASRLA